MPKYKVMATKYIFKDALIEANSEEEAISKAEEEGVDWVTVGGEWEIHEDLTFKETDE